MNDRHPAPVFLSAEHQPVQVDAELNLDPLYYNDEGPITFLALSNAMGDIVDAANGIETMLDAIPDLGNIGSQRFMIRLALERIQAVVDGIRPDKPQSRQRFVYDRSTSPPSLRPYKERLKVSANKYPQTI